jgi:hypothetical protein
MRKIILLLIPTDQGKHFHRNLFVNQVIAPGAPTSWNSTDQYLSCITRGSR